MTNSQKTIITNLRKANYPYAFIAEKIGLPKDTVKSHCRRHGIEPEITKRKTKAEKQASLICVFCGKTISNEWNRKGKRFCSDKCRTGYWNTQKLKMRRAAQAAAVAPGIPPETAPDRTGLLAPSELSSMDRR